MKKTLLSIGQMAKLNHTTIATLRLYDELNLLKPIHTDPQSRYRYYDIKQNARLDMIQYMKELGMQLQEIREVLDKKDISLIQEILIKKREDIFSEIRNLKIKKDAITKAIYGIERYRKSPVAGVVSLEYIDRRLVYSQPIEINFYDYDINTYEESLCRLKEHFINMPFPHIYFSNVGTSIQKHDFENLHFIADQIFVFIDRDFKLPEENIKEIDSGMYACIYLNRYEDEIEYAKRLLAFCQENKYTLCGDYLCEVLTELNIFDESKQRSMFLRLQVPITFQNRC